MDPRLVRYLASIGFGSDALDGWTVSVAQRDGVDCCFVLINGPEIHILPFEDGKAMTRKNVIETLTPLLDEFGYVTTRVPRTETNHKLRTTLGFEQTWQDDQFTYFALTELPFRRKSHA